MKKSAIIICSRTNSKRIFNKPMQKILGTPLLQHLINRLSLSGLPIILAVPDGQKKHYKKFKGCTVETGSEHDPLNRMYEVAKKNKIETIIRVTHDKIFVNPFLLNFSANDFSSNNIGYDYGFSSQFTDGSAFELISFKALERAATKFTNVEHISYAIKAVSNKFYNIVVPVGQQSKHRLLIDYPSDLKVIRKILEKCGPSVQLSGAIAFLDKKENYRLSLHNQLPWVSIYTCAYNAEKYIDRAMGSVSMQSVFGRCEYLLIDDCSTDKTSEKMRKFSNIYQNVTYIRNPVNLGLSSSSNVALENAKGHYMLRLDADDYFTDNTAIDAILDEIEEKHKDVIYPANWFGSFDVIQLPDNTHHIGGAIFKRKAVNHIKFTDGLRGYEGYDFFKRASGILDIGYLEEPLFFYRQHDESMSKNNLRQREEIKRKIDAASS